MATFKHISSKNADYGAAEQYLTFEHDEFTMKPTLDENGRLMLREDYRIATLNCGDEDFAVACMRSNLRYGKNQKREDVKSHHYIISFDPRDAVDNGLTVDRAQALGEEFCRKQFPGHQAMIADFAIHDPHPPGHNPHAHVLLTMRAMDEHGKWLPKSRKVYDLDENGERIKLPSGRWKSHKEDTVDWNDQKYCEIWRHEWEVIQNRYLEANDRPERVDLRS